MVCRPWSGRQYMRRQLLLVVVMLSVMLLHLSIGMCRKVMKILGRVLRKWCDRSRFLRFRGGASSSDLCISGRMNMD